MTQSVLTSSRIAVPAFKLKQGMELFTEHAGLALTKFVGMKQALYTIPKRSGLPVSEIVTAFVGPLCLGKTDFDAIENLFTQDNSKTRKEGVSRTYAGMDGYAPIAAYLGQEGWCVGVELRERTHFSSRETEYTF